VLDIDPAINVDLLPLQSDGLTRDGLITYNHVPGPDGTQLIPDLAINLPAPTDGGTTRGEIRVRRCNTRSFSPISSSDPATPGTPTLLTAATAVTRSPNRAAQASARTAARVPVGGEVLEPEVVGDLTDIVWPINHPSARLAIRKTVPGPLDHDQPNPPLIGDAVRAAHASVKSRPGRAAEEHDRAPLRGTVDRVTDPPAIIELDTPGPFGHQTPLRVGTITILWATAEPAQFSAAAEPGSIALPFPG
jgi:hypothetical protein